MCVFSHGRERIGHAQLVVAAVGVLPASVRFFFCFFFFLFWGERREVGGGVEQIYVSATSLPVGNHLCAYFHFNQRTVTVASANAHRSAHLWIFRTTLWTISLTSEDLSSAIRRGFLSLSHRLWPHIGIPEPAGPVTDLSPIAVLEKGESRGDGCNHFFFFLNHLTIFFFSLSLQRTRCDAGPVSLDLVINTRFLLLPHSSDRDPGTLDRAPDDAS